MIRNVDLVSYLPPFLAEYDTLTRTLEAENPEFRIVWDAANRVLYNAFIETADEYGISRFEKLLKIYPSKDDTLESRRLRVQVRWFDELPYTLITLLEKLIMLCGKDNFTLEHNFSTGYTLIFSTCLTMPGQVDELDNIFKVMLPCNIIVKSSNKIPCTATGHFFIGGGLCFMRQIEISNDAKTTPNIKGAFNAQGAALVTGYTEISNDAKENTEIKGTNSVNGVFMHTFKIEASNSFKENVNLESPGNFSGGAALTEIITTKGD